MTSNKNSFSTQKNINVLDFLYELARRWYLCLAVIIACLFISLVYTKVLVTPMYDSTARLYIVNKSSENISTSDFSISTYLANDFSEIIVDKVVLKDVAKELNNKYTVAELKNALSVEIPQSTRIIQVTARTENAKKSKEIVDALCTVSEEALVDIMGLDRVTVVSEGSLAINPSIPNTRRNLFLGFVFSLAICVLLVYLIIITDNKVSSAKDIEKYLGINVLATIPYNQGKQKARQNM